MTPAATNVWLMLLSALAGGSAALAASLWWSERQFPRARVFDLTRDLIERQRALETLIRRLELSPERPFLATGRTATGSTRNVPGPGRSQDITAPVATESGPTLIRVPDLASRPHADPEAELALARRFGSIWDQAEAGTPPAAIAQESGLPIGQVELILGLRRQLGIVATGAQP